MDYDPIPEYEAGKKRGPFSGKRILRGLYRTKDGKIITLSANGDMDENEKKLQNMNPLMIEKFPLTLEEIFLEEMEGSDYDFKDIFGKPEEKK